ncbi:flagellar hook-associated protein FlgK [Neptunomonas sp.]|uniref:flagellar hook-associated protein FlgK n=1 Tax=Neptunomonas sp. TaxID=1971898 RepID=UPI0025FD214D|nr:flagellar hook-associated protein FlgK [Neptunomonas sp.]
MSSFNLLNLGNQAIRTNQAALSTVGQNISNVNTPGYSRQIANFSTLPDQSGVVVDSIDRITNQFLTQQLWADLSSYNQSSTFSELSSQLDNLLATKTSSVSTALDSYFSALQNVVDDPVSTPNRELFVAESDALVKRFNSLDAHIQRQNNTVNESLDDLASKVNSLSTNIAELNANIQLQVASNKPANELKDQRDELTNQLSELIGITVLEQQNADSYSIFVGNGEPLVTGISANQFEVVPGDPDISQRSLSLKMANSSVDVTNVLSGGKIGGLLEYRENALNTARDELGRIAIGFAESMNTAHRAGIDLNNELGGNLFSDVNSFAAQADRISAGFGNHSNVLAASVEIQDTTKLQASDYELFYGSDSEITLTRNSDGKKIEINLLADAVDNRSVPSNALTWGGNVAPSVTPAAIVTQVVTPTLNGVAAPGVSVDSAQVMAATLNGLVGVSGVTAESAINLSNIVDGGADGVSFDVTVNDATGNVQTVTVPLAAGVFSDGNIASAINAALSADPNDFSHLAVSTPTSGGVKIVDSTGGNISVRNNGAAGDSISIQNYSSNGNLVAGGPVAVSPGNTGSVVGYLKDNTATVDSSVESLSLSAGVLVGATTVLVDGTNNVESTRGDTVLGVEDVGEGEFYMDPGGNTLSFAIDGIKVSIETTNFIKGDRFLIQPVRSGADNLSLIVKDGRQLALASPVRVTADTDNIGAGKASVQILDSIASAFDASGDLKPPVDIVFNNSDPLTYTAYDMTEPLNPIVLEVDNKPLLNQTYSAGSDIGLKGYNVVITDQPKAGDRFSFTFNKDGVSDNRNALVLSGLQQESTLDGGSYQDLYGSLVERVGTRTATSIITVDANKAVLDSTVTAKSSVSGVNLDEEAAKLVQFQQAYQASAQLIRTSQTLFDTLLSSI